MSFEDEHDEAPEPSKPAPDHVDFSRFAMGEMIPLKGYWFKVAGRDGNHLVLRFVSISTGALREDNGNKRLRD